MALRTVLTEENPALRKVCRPYTAFNDRLHQLLDDMRETLIEEDGVGLAAPQVGILRRACIVLETNVGEDEQPYFIDLEPYFYDKTNTVMDYGFSIDGLHPDIRGKMLMGEIINTHKDRLAD